MTNFRLFHNKEFADNNFELDENSRKLSKQVENTDGKGEIARYEQFLLFRQRFQKTWTVDMQNPGLVWERVYSTNWQNPRLVKNENICRCRHKCNLKIRK